MIARSYVQSNLKGLDRLFLRAKTPKEALYYSKLALLELCGWIEETMDDVVVRCSVRCLADAGNRKHIKDGVVKRNYGFEYHRHFRQMLVQVVGLSTMESLERRFDHTKHARLIATLASLKALRDSEAHTHLKGVTHTIAAPSVTLSYFTAVYEGLVDIDSTLRSGGH